MSDQQVVARDLERLVVPRAGRLNESGDRWMPWELLEPSGAVVQPVAAYFADLLAADRSTGTLRSYGMDLLRWYRFLWAIDTPWDRATRLEARDFMRWHRTTDKPSRGDRAAAAVNPLTGKPNPAPKYATSTKAKTESVLRCFYDFHLHQGSGPLLNPFPKARFRDGRAHAHHNPMDVFPPQRVGLYRPKVAQRIPKSIPDDMFDRLFAGLPSHRDRALVAFYVSSGARASELLGLQQGDADAGSQLISVIRKGSEARQQVPASSDAFVWLRLYQEQLRRMVPAGARHPLWWTLRVPHQPLAYHAAYAMFRRVNERLGTNWTLHDLRPPRPPGLARIRICR